MDDQEQQTPAPSRRALMIGAVGASAVISIRPALAQTMASVSTCEIPVPDPARSGNYIAADGSVVAPRTPGAFPGAPRPFKGEEVKAALNGGNLPGTDYERSRAYTAYIRRLQQRDERLYVLRVAADAASLMTVFRAAAPELLRLVPLDDLTLAYHRSAGATHLLAEPAPQIVAALQDNPADINVLLTRLGVGPKQAAALSERLEELIAAGLVEAEEVRAA